MRNSLLFLVLLLSACGGQTEKNISNTTTIDTLKNTKQNNQIETSWLGTINNKIPVFLHYSIHREVIVGEITYLNTKNKKPIKLLGTIEEDKSYRLLEFEKDGNISGIITGNPDPRVFNGNWFSPKTRQELQVKLSIKDTLIETSDYQAENKDMYGTYHYQYSEEGYQGDLAIKKLRDNKVEFNIFSVTGAPGRNIAEVAADTIQMTGNTFTYKIPDTDSCEFKVTFFKGFSVVNYTKGYCSGQFGLNASIDGIFLKVRE
jgi:hypothetical protein